MFGEPATTWEDTPSPRRLLPDHAPLIGTVGYRARVLPALKRFYTDGLPPITPSFADAVRLIAPRPRPARAVD
jgi:hypothetical protein